MKKRKLKRIIREEVMKEVKSRNFGRKPLPEEFEDAVELLDYYYKFLEGRLGTGGYATFAMDHPELAEEITKTIYHLDEVMTDNRNKF